MTTIQHSQKLFESLLMGARIITALTAAGLSFSSFSAAAPERRLFTDGNRYLIVEVLDDDLVHFELAGAGTPTIEAPIYTTPMVAKTDYSGPTSFTSRGRTMETAALIISVAANLCVRVDDKHHGITLQETCPQSLESSWKTIQINAPSTRHAYGLGQYFSDEQIDGDWLGRVWDPLSDSFGARMRAFAGGANSYAMFPILYALGDGRQSHAIFLDSIYKQMWDFRSTPWTVGLWGDHIRWYVLSGPDLIDLRRDYMELSGRPPVPPRRSFGLWVSEFGFESWQELYAELTELRAQHMPVDGFAMDLQWFGGTFGDPDRSRMGSLQWDETRFPAYRDEIARLAQTEGIQLMPIEEPYISITLDEHRELASRGYLVKDCETCGPTYLDSNPWWGRGGMLDFTNPAAASFWHDYRRRDLNSLGIHDHWTDLGEPEQYNAHAWYHGFPALGKHAQADIHNIYAFRWMESIDQGYRRQGDRRGGARKRPFLLSRTGTSGIQRFGVGLWSGDIGSDWGNLRSQMQAQMHMSFSGIDYYGSDAGGFQRNSSGVEGGQERLYTQWFAASAALDVPLRPHAWNLDKKRPTSPARRGEVVSNQQNLKLRYSLIPYYYSLGFAAHRYGDPVFPSPIHFFQTDPNLRRAGSLKMIGPSLITAVVADAHAVSHDVYLPAGEWTDYHSHTSFNSRGETHPGYPLYPQGFFQLPLLARAGAIIPTMPVHQDTMNASGRRLSGAATEALHVKVFASREASHFDLFEDDGESYGYEVGQFARTRISQQLKDSQANITVSAHEGSYAGMKPVRPFTIELVAHGQEAASVELNGKPVPVCSKDGSLPCFHNPSALSSSSAQTPSTAAPQSILLNAGHAARSMAQNWRINLRPQPPQGSSLYLVCKNAVVAAGHAVYAAGSIAELGEWQSAKGIKLTPTAYPTWSALVSHLPSGTLSWKCIQRPEDDPSHVTWQPGNNNTVHLPEGKYAGASVGSF